MDRAFDFLVLTGPVDLKNAEYRRNVHSQSMRAFRRNERVQQVRTYEQSRPKRSERSPSAQMSIPPCKRAPVVYGSRSEISHRTKEQHSTESHINLVAMGVHVGAELFDPFNSMPLPLSKDQQTLLAHFTWRIGMIPMPIATSHPDELWTHMWLRRAIASPLLLISICYHASEHLDTLHGCGSSRTSLQLRGATLHRLTETLYHPKGAVAADTIASLQLLVTNGMISGNAGELTLHMEALDKIVTLRGGLESHGFEGVLRSVIRWHFAPCTMLTHIHIPNRTLRDAYDSELVLVHASMYHETLESLLQQCRALQSYPEAGRFQEAARITTSQEFNEKRTALDHQFVDLWRQLEDCKHHGSPIVETLKYGCLAGLLVTFSLLPGFGPHSVVAKKVTGMVLETANEIQVTSHFDTSQARYWDIRLWSLAVATVLSDDLSRRTQLATLTRTTKDIVGIGDFGQLIVRLQTLVWDSGIWDECLRDAIRD